MSTSGTVTSDGRNTRDRRISERRTEYPPPRANTSPAFVINEIVQEPDRIHWGGVFGGLFTALTVVLLLNLLGAGLGLTALGSVGPATAQTARDGAANAGVVTAMWTGVAGIIAFLCGGYVAGRVPASNKGGVGALNGAMVFMLAVPVTLLLAGMGLGVLMGSLGSLAAALDVRPEQLQATINSMMTEAQRNANSISPEEAANSARQVAQVGQAAAWGTLIASLLGLGSAAIGGTWGARGGKTSEGPL